MPLTVTLEAWACFVTIFRFPPDIRRHLIMQVLLITTPWYPESLFNQDPRKFTDLKEQQRPPKRRRGRRRPEARGRRWPRATDRRRHQGYSYNTRK